MKVTFDSNTWRKVASPDNFPKDPIILDYRIIREAINSRIITPFISETIFTIEAIQKKHRKNFFRDYIAAKKSVVSEDDDGVTRIHLKIESDENAHPGNNDFLKEHLEDAVQLGFNIIRLPRIAGVSNKDIEGLRYKMDSEALDKFQHEAFKVGRRITELQAGDYAIQQLGLRYNSNSGFLGIGNAPDSEDGIIAKAVAEWADGDSVASHVAIGGDYFCSNDKAVSAGEKSIFSKTNLTILETEFSFKKITPTDLAAVIKTR